ncbi:hypothetical protein NBRC116188_01630 [Oceaniserpentilla sp. 4NH20-0058]|uniref:type II secretion system protein M n=1 Tax=Oceaniserpentilla sp. 4NH20-0058 TaxID=3127660 RepID=UPI00310AD8E6
MANGIDNLKRNLKIQLEQSSLYKSTHNWFTNLAEKDQKLVKLLGIVVSIAIVYSWVWSPVSQKRDSAIKRYESEMAFHTKMKENAYLFGAGTSTSAGGNKSILSTVNNTAKVKNIHLKRFEPDGDTGLRIWLDKVNFNSAIDWLELLESSRGIKVEQISIDKVEPGIVNIRAVLKS